MGNYHLSSSPATHACLGSRNHSVGVARHPGNQHAAAQLSLTIAPVWHDDDGDFLVVLPVPAREAPRAGYLLLWTIFTHNTWNSLFPDWATETSVWRAIATAGRNHSYLPYHTAAGAGNGISRHLPLA